MLNNYFVPNIIYDVVEKYRKPMIIVRFSTQVEHLVRNLHLRYRILVLRTLGRVSQSFDFWFECVQSVVRWFVRIGHYLIFLKRTTIGSVRGSIVRHWKRTTINRTTSLQNKPTSQVQHFVTSKLAT